MEIKNKKTHTLIVSDFHLGSRVSRSDKVYELLKDFKFRKLILLGDIFENLNFRRLNENDWKLLYLISQFSKTRKVKWIRGNHDRDFSRFFQTFTGAKIYRYYRWQYKNKKYLAIHGHQFDNFLRNNEAISYLATVIYNFVQLFDFKDKRLSRLIKQKSKKWLKVSKKVASRALLYGKIMQVDYIFCGHTHKAMKSKSRGVTYYNSGCWTDVPSTYITIDQDKIEIHNYN